MSTVVVIGLGSMGKRRIRLIKKINSELRLIGVDSNAERTEFARNEYGIDVYQNLDTAIEENSIECAIISTSPISHGKIVNQCLKAGIHVFTELNLVTDFYAENISLAEERGLTLFLSSTFLYRDEISYIRKRVEENNQNLNYCYHVGQYLPDWHPWETIADFFVSDSRTNGCREIFAIEMPWIVKTFGSIKSYEVMKSKMSELNIGYPDNYLVTLQHENGNKGVLAVDVVSRKAVRNLEVYSETLYLTWDGSPHGLKEYDIQTKFEKSVDLYENVDRIDGYSSFIIENAYQRELEKFFNVVEKKEPMIYTFEEDSKILGIIDGFEGK